MSWPLIDIDIRSGREKALAPAIISASRRTDIPAHFSRWLVNRLQAGYVRWVNPYTGRNQTISLAHARAMVLWTKNPAPLISYLHHFQDLETVVLYTVNDYASEGLEPGLPDLSERIHTFQRLSRRLGSERVIWRFDPLLLAQGLTPRVLLDRAEHIGRQLAGFCHKLIFSLAEISGYAKVRRNMLATGIEWREFTETEMLDTAAALKDMAEKWGMHIASCAQATDLTRVGVQPSRCIDPNLLQALVDTRADSRNGWEQLPLPGLPKPGKGTRIPRGKDPGQRSHCQCAPSKDIGQYNTCPHGCVYCYANSSFKIQN